VERNNHSLLSRLASVATRKAGGVAGAPPPPPVRSSQEVNRLREAKKIEAANFQLLKRLQTARPSAGLAAARPSGGGGVTKKAPRYRAPPEERPPWVELSGGLGSGAVAPSGGAGASAPAGGRSTMFRSRDIRDVAMEACPETHLTRMHHR